MKEKRINIKKKKKNIDRYLENFYFLKTLQTTKRNVLSIEQNS